MATRVMGRVFRGMNRRLHLQNRQHQQLRMLSAPPPARIDAALPPAAVEEETEERKRMLQQQADEKAARDNNLDFEGATRMLFNEPNRRKHFGLDWHLWQLFVALLPSLLVYLLALYARSEIRRLEKERGIPPVKKEWSRRYEHAKEQREYAARLQMHGAVADAVTISKEDLASLKDRINLMEEKVKHLETSAPVRANNVDTASCDPQRAEKSSAKDKQDGKAKEK